MNLQDLLDLAARTGQDPKDLLMKIAAGGELAAQTVTGGLASLGGGLTYLPAAAIGGDKAGQAVMAKTQEALTYAPRTDQAKAALEALAGYVGPVAKSGGVGAQHFGQVMADYYDSPLIGAMARTAPTAISEFGDRLRLGKLAKPVTNEITAYHGSPHDFDEFRLNQDTIGTGEGAQAYGHGLYFAENPGVAKQYQAGLSDIDWSAADSKKMLEKLRPYAKRSDRAWEIVNEADGGAGAEGVRSAIEDYFNELHQDPDFQDSAIRAAKESGARPSGRLYTVDIPDEHVAKMLDWDKPLSEQPEAVREAIQAASNDPALDDYTRTVLKKGGTGGAIINALHVDDNLGGTQSAAAKYLASIGITGIRYLDAGSRDGGTGTRNIVAFDDKIIKVLKKE
jgi:hypothetical protein